MANMRSTAALVLAFSAFFPDVCASVSSSIDNAVVAADSTSVSITGTGQWQAPVSPFFVSVTTATSVTTVAVAPNSSTSFDDPPWAPTPSPTLPSTRPQASGFWTDTDPFSFVPPRTSSTARSNVDSGTTVIDSSGSSASTEHDSTEVGTSATTTGGSTISSTLITSSSISISTHTNIVTATPSRATSTTDSVTVTTTEGQTPTSSSEAEKNKQFSNGFWGAVGFMVAVSGLL